MQSTSPAQAQFEEKLLDLSSSIDEFEGYMHAHALRIAEIADLLGKVFGMSAHDRHVLQRAALIHDIGEMAMGRAYIRENRLLNDAERMDLHRHPVIGEQEAARRGFPRGVQLLVRWHHESWDGSGYPDGLEGEQIPLGARILKVADTFAALTDDRPRRKAMTDENARQYLTDLAGLDFDPAIVKAFLEFA